MAYSGYLISMGGRNFPLIYIKPETYKITPNQRMETKATRDATGELHRTTVEHTASKIEFETTIMSNLDLADMMYLIRSSWSDVTERKITISYYDPETDSYKSAICYMPDIDYTINYIDQESNLVYFNSIRICFIEY